MQECTSLLHEAAAAAVDCKLRWVLQYFQLKATRTTPCVNEIIWFHTRDDTSGGGATGGGTWK